MLGYIKARLLEPSTWAAFAGGAAAADALSAPWSYIAIGCAVAGALVPEKGKAND